MGISSPHVTRGALGALIAASIYFTGIAPARAEAPLAIAFASADVAPTQKVRASAADHDHDERWFALSASGLAMAAIRKGHAPEAEGGFVGALEFTVIPNWLEIELGVHYIRGPEKTFEVPVDLLFKKPWHVTTWLEPYIGIGPSVVTMVSERETVVHPGVATTAGTHFWFSHHFGLATELNYNIVAHHGPVHQIAGVSGVVAAW